LLALPSPKGFVQPSSCDSICLVALSISMALTPTNSFAPTFKRHARAPGRASASVLDDLAEAFPAVNALQQLINFFYLEGSKSIFSLCVLCASAPLWFVKPLVLARWAAMIIKEGLRAHNLQDPFSSASVRSLCALCLCGERRKPSAPAQCSHAS